MTLLGESTHLFFTPRSLMKKLWGLAPPFPRWGGSSQRRTSSWWVTVLLGICLLHQMTLLGESTHSFFTNTSVFDEKKSRVRRHQWEGLRGPVGCDPKVVITQVGAALWVWKLFSLKPRVHSAWPSSSISLTPARPFTPNPFLLFSYQILSTQIGPIYEKSEENFHSNFHSNFHINYIFFHRDRLSNILNFSHRTPLRKIKKKKKEFPIIFSYCFPIKFYRLR